MGRARALMEADNSVEALSVLEDALAMADDSFAVPLNRMIASAAEDAGKYSRAADALRDLAAGDPTRPQVYLEDKIARLERMHQESQQNTDS
jgi:thioredoxin-like negative regulator of GroEL